MIDEDDLSEKMFMALTHPVKPRTISAVDKKYEIVKFIDLTTLEARRNIARAIKRYGYEKELKQSNSGLVVNLAILPDHIIDEIYTITMKFVK